MPDKHQKKASGVKCIPANRYRDDPAFKARCLENCAKYHSKRSTKDKTNLRVRRRYSADEFFRLQKSFYNRRRKIRIKLNQKLLLKDGVLQEFLNIAKKLGLPHLFENYFLNINLKN